MSGKRNQAPKVFNDRWKYLLLVLILFMYGKSVRYGFVLDDDLFIRNHPLVQKGVAAIPTAFGQGSMLHFQGSNFQIYRPFLVSSFALQKSLFGFNAPAFHFVSLILYASLCLMVYGLIRCMSPGVHPLIALLTTALFTVHPVHSEVVANIKSQDELLAALGCVASLFWALRYFDTKSSRFLMASVTSFLFALFSKESAAAFLVAYPITFFLFRSISSREIVLRSVPYILCVMIFVLSRHFALAGLRQDFETTLVENVLYGAKDMSQLWATKAAILLYYIKLIVWPVSLSWDYSFNQIPLSDWTEIQPIASVVLFVSLLLTALLCIRRFPVFTWGIGLFLLLILPTSNIFFLNGTTFAERFLFLPSLGAVAACMPLLTFVCIGRPGSKVANPKPSLVIMFFAVVSVAAVATSSRVSDWKDNLTLFESGVRNAPNSSRVQAGLATEYMNIAEKSMTAQARSKYVELSKTHFQKALAIYPENSNAAYKLGLIFSLTGDTSQAISYYRVAIRTKPDQVFARVNLSTIHASRAQWDSAAFHLEQAFKYDSLNQMVLTNLVVVNFNRGNDGDVRKYGAVIERNRLGSAKTDELIRASSARSGNR